jgi:xanthine dehydrogenase accessory factor
VEVYDALSAARARGQAVVLVTVLAVEGEVASRAGAKLVSTGEQPLAGTLGCSEFDTAANTLAAEALAGGEHLRRRLTFPGHGRERALELFAEIHLPQPAVLVLGATPVGRALAALAHTLGRRAVLLAPGGDAAAGPGVEVRADDPARALLAAPPGDHDAVVVTDHDAAWVDEVLRVALASDAYFVGMLGSRRHAPAVVERLAQAGVPADHLQRLRSPCGLDIGSRSAEEIALSIAAELVAVERGRPGGPLRLDR